MNSENARANLAYSSKPSIFIVLEFSFVGPFFTEDIKLYDWLWILMICILGTTAHYFVIKAYQVSQASILQPFNYLQLVFVSIIGIFIFDEILEMPIVIGSVIIVSAGLYTFWRDKQERIDHL